MIYECTKVVGHETFKVGFADCVKAYSWFDENLKHYHKLKDENRLFEDVYLEVKSEGRERSVHIDRCIKPFVSIELSVHDLFTIKNVLSKRLSELKANRLYDDRLLCEEIEVETLLKRIEMEIDKYYD